MKDFWSFQLGIQKDDDHPSCIDPTYCLGWLGCFVEMDGEHFWGKGRETNEWQMWRKMICSSGLSSDDDDDDDDDDDASHDTCCRIQHQQYSYFQDVVLATGKYYNCRMVLLLDPLSMFEIVECAKKNQDRKHVADRSASAKLSKNNIDET